MDLSLVHVGVGNDGDVELQIGRFAMIGQKKETETPLPYVSNCEVTVEQVLSGFDFTETYHPRKSESYKDVLESIKDQMPRGLRLCGGGEV